MSDTSNALGAELFSIYQAGAETIPRVAALYAGATGDAYNAGWLDVQAFHHLDATDNGNADDPDTSRLPGYDPTGGSYDLGPVHPEWAALRTALHSILYQTADILIDAGAALVQIARTYAESDAEAATAMNSLITEWVEDTGAEPIHVPEPVGLDYAGLPVEEDQGD